MDIKPFEEVDSLHLDTMTKDFENGKESRLSLLEKRLLILTRLRKFSTVIEEGYHILELHGPDPLVYKCVLVSLCRTAQTVECNQLLAEWKKSSPNDPVRKDSKKKILSFISAVQTSKVDPCDSLIYLEKSLGLCDEWVYRNCGESTGNWRFRTPPRQLSTSKYTLCPAPVDCFYGVDCPSAHSPEELDEWRLRMDFIGNNFFEMNLNSSKQLEPIGSNKYKSGYSNSRGPRLINTQSNGAFHMPNGLFTTTQTFQFSNGRTVTTNSYANENPFLQNYGIPPNIPYLNELIAKYKASANLPSCFVSEMSEVKFKSFSSASLKTRNHNHQWSFALASRDALRTVSLLHNEDRRHFHISDGTFYYGSRPVHLKNLHAVNRNAGLQVLNTFIPSDIIKDYGGWPQWFYYKIELSFRTELPGQYRQTIVFDFKKDPKLIKEVSIEVAESDEPALSTNVPIADTGAVKVVVVDSNSGFPIENGGWFSSPRNSGQGLHLNKQNYVQEMTKILGLEISCRQAELKKLDSFQNLTPTNVCIVEGEQKVGSQLYCTIELGNSLSEDSPVGKLIQRSCHQVLLTSSDYPSRSYMCAITEKLKTSIVIALGKAIVQDLALKVNKIYNFKVQLHLDVKYFDKMKRALNFISDTELVFLFPDFTREVIFEEDLLNIFLQGAFTLNPRQMDAYTAITESSAIGLNQVPPVLLLGPAGTGKTLTLCQSVKKLLRCQPNCRVLICTHSNSAADIYITTMDEWNLTEFRPLRVYFHDRRVQTVSYAVKKYCTFDASSRFRYPTKEEICRHRVIVTTLSISPELVRIGLGKTFFTHIIIDEAAQVLETEAIEPLLLANPNTRVVLAGDHMQLSPELFATHGNTFVNILERLNSLYPKGHPCKIMLNENYRNQEKILKFAGEHFYSGLLLCSTIQPTHPQLYPLSFFSVRGQESLGPNSFFNSAEIQELGARLQYLISFWPPQWGDVEDPSSIAILTPYADQVQRLRAHLRLRNLAFVSVERVQNVQGKQFRVVFISTVRTVVSAKENELDLGFLSNPKLFNTALTRAQSLVAVVGDPVSLCTSSVCRNIWLAFIREAMLNKALYGINYEQLKTTLAELDLRGGTKSSTQNNVLHNPQPIAQMHSPPLPPAQPSIFNSFHSNFGPSLLASPTLTTNGNNIEALPEPRQNAFPDTLSTSFATNNLNTNLHYGAQSMQGRNYDQLLLSNSIGLHNPNMASPNSAFYQSALNNFNHNLVNAHSQQPNNLVLNGHPILNGGSVKPIKNAQLSPPPGFSEHPGAVNMFTFESFVKKSLAEPTRSAPASNGVVGGRNFSNGIKENGGSQASAISAMKTQSNEMGNARKKQTSSKTTSNSSVFEFPLEDFPSLTKEHSKKPSDWIEVKTKKPKAPAAAAATAVTNGKAKRCTEKTVVEKIETLVSMGFEKKRAIKALQMSDKDLEKATDLLLAGKEKTGFKDKDKTTTI